MAERESTTTAPEEEVNAPSTLSFVAGAAMKVINPLEGAASKVMEPLEDYDFSLTSILASIKKQATFDRSYSDLDQQVVPPIHSEAVQSLLDQGAKWKPIKEIHEVNVHLLANVPYGSEPFQPRQSLDIYFPRDKAATADTSNTTMDKLPVYIHVHGGGWSRGAKDNFIYGGPAMCQNAAADAGCIAVAVGYRLGRYPEFVHDVALAIRWVYDNIASLGGDLSNVFLSGHSAGAHIASLLTVRHRFFLEEPHGIPRNFFRGLVLVSGVYDLFSPMKTNIIDFKNKWLFLYYVTPAFGTDTNLKREASPLLLLNPDKETSMLGTMATTLTRKISEGVQMVPSILPGPLKSAVSNNSSGSLTGSVTESSRELFESEWAGSNGSTGAADNFSPPSTLILNATFDMGLQENGQLMAEALGKYTEVKYQIIQGSDHASICWNATTALVIADFIRSQLTTAPPRKRRGKRDKIPTKDPQVTSLAE
jgi:acetyl esterase/lipase